MTERAGFSNTQTPRPITVSNTPRRRERGTWSLETPLTLKGKTDGQATTEQSRHAQFFQIGSPSSCRRAITGHTSLLPCCVSPVIFSAYAPPPGSFVASSSAPFLFLSPCRPSTKHYPWQFPVSPLSTTPRTIPPFLQSALFLYTAQPVPHPSDFALLTLHHPILPLHPDRDKRNGRDEQRLAGGCRCF